MKDEDIKMLIIYLLGFSTSIGTWISLRHYYNYFNVIFYCFGIAFGFSTCWMLFSWKTDFWYK